MYNNRYMWLEGTKVIGIWNILIKSLHRKKVLKQKNHYLFGEACTYN